jgi:hypothetical protein
MCGLDRVWCVLLLMFSSFGFAQTNSAVPTPLPAGQSAGAIPRLMKVSGTIPNGRGTLGVTFALYKDQTGGAPLWQEIQNVTPDAEGHYTIDLGANHTDGLPLDLFATGEARWLGVQVEGQAEQARILLVSVPYAIASGDAQTLGGKPLSAFVLSGTTTGTGSDGLNYVNTDAITAVAATLPQSVTGTQDFVAKFDSTGAGLINSSIFDNGSVGIGTTSPLATALHVVAPGSSTTNPGMLVDVFGSTLSAVPVVYRAARGKPTSPSAVQAGDIIGGLAGRAYGATGFSNGGRAGVIFKANEPWTDTAQSTYINFNTTPLGTTAQQIRMVLTDQGRLGIGGTNPGQLLSVAGTIESTSGGFKFPDGTIQTTAGASAQSFVDLSSNQTIGGTKTFSSSINGSISGNAGTVTNGVYTTGSYSDPSWLTSLNAAKLAGAVPLTSGGTGATTASDARANLGAMGKYSKVAIVAQSGGDYTDPASALSDVSSWCGTPSASNPSMRKRNKQFVFSESASTDFLLYPNPSINLLYSVANTPIE